MNTHHETPKPPCPVGATHYAALLPRLRAGMLSQREQEALREHLRACATCQDEAAAAADQVIEDGVRRHFGVPAQAAPFLMLDDIRRRASLTVPDATHDPHMMYRRPRGAHYRRPEGGYMTFDEQQSQSSSGGGWPIQPGKKPGRWRTVVGVASAVALIALFALLLRGFAAGKGASNPAATASVTTTADASNTATAQTPTSSAHGQWHTVDSMGYTTQSFTQTPYPAFSPVNPAIVYEATLTPTTVRRSDDGGATWQALNLPAGSDQAIEIEIFASPLNAHVAFLTVTVNLAYGQGPSGCPSSARALVGGATHGNIVASGQVPCSTTYRTTNEGQSWKAINFPVNGTISTPYSDSAPYAGALLQAQGTRLYALLTCGPTCSGPAARLVASGDGGITWRVADGGIGQGICDYAAQADSQTVFAAVSNGACDVLNSPELGLYRSNNGGQSWLTVGSLPQNSAPPWKTASQGMAVVTVGGKPLLVMNLPKVTWQPHIIGVTQTADEFYVSSDGGHTWKVSPLKGVPDKAQPIISPLIVRADGSLVVAFAGEADQGLNATLYTWKPGQASWKVFAPAPDGHLSALLRTVSNTGDETFWAVVNAGAAQVGNTQTFTFAVASYQP